MKFIIGMPNNSSRVDKIPGIQNTKNNKRFNPIYDV